LKTVILTAGTSQVFDIGSQALIAFGGAGTSQ
jgi:hypothetical protein